MSESQPQFETLLRSGMPGYVLSLLVSFIGLAALVVHFLRRKSKDRSLLWFGLFASLYGIRALSREIITRRTLDLSPMFWGYLGSVISDTIITPAVLFFEQFYGKGWRSSLRWVLWIQAAWGAIAIIGDFILRRPGTNPDPSTFLITVLPVLLLIGYWRGYRPPQSSRAAIIFGGGAVFVIAVIIDHLSQAALLPWRFLVEPFGFMVNLACLGYVAVQRFVSNEQELVAIEEEMKSARRIQSSILPRSSPELPGVKIAARYLPMKAVAGDFYDFLQNGEGGLGILVADVTGHGVPAALVASMVKVAISSQTDHAPNPAAVVSALNHIMCRQAQGQFTTAGYLYLDPCNRIAHYAAAGHPPLLLWRSAQGSIQEFRENGLLLGIRPSEQYPSTRIALEPGDRILMYTDGVPEAADDAGEFFGDDRLKVFLEKHSKLPTDTFADTLVNDVAAWSGISRGTQSDDITLVVVDIDDCILSR
ncbi:MAG: SpoIIE family protein phosphatase [Bryobacteraceae bacterium]